jgi:hypothetical protein
MMSLRSGRFVLHGERDRVEGLARTHETLGDGWMLRALAIMRGDEGITVTAAKEETPDDPLDRWLVSQPVAATRRLVDETRREARSSLPLSAGGPL